MYVGMRIRVCSVYVWCACVHACVCGVRTFDGAVLCAGHRGRLDDLLQHDLAKTHTHTHVNIHTSTHTLTQTSTHALKHTLTHT
jgi:hypothetical protein